MIQCKGGESFYRSAEQFGNVIGTYTEYESVFAKFPWQEVLARNGSVTRKSAWFTENDCTCHYSYAKWPKGGWAPQQYNDLLVKLARQTEQLLGLDTGYLNSCNANLYSLPSHDLYWHSDDEKLFREAEAPKDKRKVLIVSLSFGATRTFRMRAKMHGDESIVEVELKDGDIITMEDLFQDNFQHTIALGKNRSTATSSSATSTRISLTFRRILRHHNSCLTLH